MEMTLIKMLWLLQKVYKIKATVNLDFIVSDTYDEIERKGGALGKKKH